MGQIEKLKQLSDNQLIDIVKNYRQYGYTEELREAAITLLEEKGITRERLQFTGNMTNDFHRRAKEIYHSFTSNMRWAMICYIGALILLAFDITILALLSMIGMYVFLILAVINEDNFYKHTHSNNQSRGVMNIVVLLFASVLFFILYFYYKKRMKDKLATLTQP